MVRVTPPLYLPTARRLVSQHSPDIEAPATGLVNAAPAHSIDFPLLLDPGFKLGAFFTSDATPLNLLVDARTMRVIDATMGYSADYWQRLDRLLAKNQ